ncbi:hypothetical protein PHET_11947 [Paragonimus heterotremus]|uniref:Uncharacterized protein n=1 Tax=Paragonimus heterotremus TaxID=100268 RepID=A0A8J4WDD5_9TREM|nr:hypothetical protein PHET_11947 [Paragonimus heterotremus]
MKPRKAPPGSMGLVGVSYVTNRIMFLLLISSILILIARIPGTYTQFRRDLNCSDLCDYNSCRCFGPMGPMLTPVKVTLVRASMIMYWTVHD